MEAVAASVIAVLGTLLGSALTHAFQQRTVARNESFARAEKLRQERLDAYSAYAAALLNHRRSLVHRWFCTHENPPPADPDEARVRSYETRSAAQETLFRAHLITDDGALVRRAHDVLDEITGMGGTDDRAVFDERRRHTRALIHDLVTAAKHSIGADR